MLANAHTIAFTMSMQLASKPMPDGRPSIADMLLAWGWESFKQQFNF